MSKWLSHFVNESTNSYENCLAVHLLPFRQGGVNTKDDVQIVAVTCIISFSLVEGRCFLLYSDNTDQSRFFSVPKNSRMSLFFHDSFPWILNCTVRRYSSYQTSDSSRVITLKKGLLVLCQAHKEIAYSVYSTYR
jgi:hypothetical protein